MGSTVIGPRVTIDGEVIASEPLVVQGVIKGVVRLEEIVHIEAGGQIEAEVHGRDVVIEGTLSGEVSARDRVEIKLGGKMLGDVKTPRLLIADGALFRGNIEMDV